MAGKKPWDKKRKALQGVLRQMRLDAGLKQIEVAERIDAGQDFVSRYERGERRLDLIELKNICEACGGNLGALVRKFEHACEEL